MSLVNKKIHRLSNIQPASQSYVYRGRDIDFIQFKISLDPNYLLK
jgi:hypothetical protein